MERPTHPYRWIILIFYFILTVSLEIQWLSFASITDVAMEFYGVSNLGIDFFSIIYMVVFIILSIPASYIIDAYGLKKGLLIGAYLTGASGLLKAFGGQYFVLAVIAQTGLAIAQPFILNSLTKLGAKWFPMNERATVAGIGTLAQYLGIVIALALTPLIINAKIEGFNFHKMLVIYGSFSAISAILVIFLIKDPPKNAEVNSNPAIRISPA